MSRLHLVADGDEIVRRRGLVPKGTVVEAWPDLVITGLFWIDEESKATLDGLGAPLAAHVTIPADAVPIYYGPRLCDLESLPREASLRARVLSGHGIAVAWITLDRFGERTSCEPQSPTDPVFYLRRIGGGAAHVWRLFQRRREAIVSMTEAYGHDSEAAEWAERLPVEDWDDFLGRHATGTA